MLYLRQIKIPIIILLLLSACTSCVTTKNVTYLQSNDELDTLRYETIQNEYKNNSVIQPHDILSIVVSSLSQESNEVFNYINSAPLLTSNFPSAGANKTQPLGYLVDENGKIDLPMVGKVSVQNMSLNEASEKIRQVLSPYLKDLVVNVRLLNQKFTVIGEVNKPGTYNLLDDKTNIFEVIGTAGDLTVFGRRDNITLIRNKTNDQKELIRLDIRSRKIVGSPYFYVRNNDIIYVSPTQGKITASDRTLQLIPIVTGVATTLVLLLNLFLKK